MSRPCRVVPLSIPSHSPMVHKGSHRMSACPDHAVQSLCPSHPIVPWYTWDPMGCLHVQTVPLSHSSVPLFILSHSPMVDMRSHEMCACPMVDLAILLPTDIPWDPMCTTVGNKMAKTTMGHVDIPWDSMYTMGLWDRMDRGTERHSLDMQTSRGISCVPQWAVRWLSPPWDM